MPKNNKLFVVILDAANDDVEKDLLKDNVHLESWSIRDIRDIHSKDIGDVDVLMIWHTVKFGAEELSACHNLKLVVRMGVGFENIDIDAAAKKNVQVVNMPAYGVEEVADHTMSLIHCLYRNIPATSQQMKQGHIVTAHGTRLMRGQILGIIGLGRIGTAVAQRAHAHGFEICFFDPNLADGVHKSFGYTRVETLDSLVEQADCIALTCSKNERNTHMINDERLSKMKPGVFVVNTARGSLVDEAALVKHLQSGHVAGAALDVNENEPFDPNTSALKDLNNNNNNNNSNLIITAHSAWYSNESLLEMKQTACSQIIQFANNTTPLKNVVNKHLFPATATATAAVHSDGATPTPHSTTPATPRKFFFF